MVDFTDPEFTDNPDEEDMRNDAFLRELCKKFDMDMDKLIQELKARKQELLARQKQFKDIPKEPFEDKWQDDVKKHRKVISDESPISNSFVLSTGELWMEGQKK